MTDAELFEDAAPAAPASTGAMAMAPLADRMRPRSFDEMLGQQQLVAPGAPLRTLIESEQLPSLLLWGPPGSGKTTLARLIASAQPGAHYRALSAVMAGLKDLRTIVGEAQRAQRQGRRTVFFLDEIHRFNRAQQDALLPHVESGLLTLVGATTENPSFEVIGPLLSRCRVFTLAPLEVAELEALLRRACDLPERGLGGLRIEDDAVRALASAADGDARRALGMLESAAAWQRGGATADAPLSVAALREAIGQRALYYDRDREQHYDTISAFIKSLRASDPDAALYYLARMLEGGEDPLFIARRLLIFASEDVGNADPAALSLALAAYQTVERIGLPEGRLALAQATTCLACAPKSNSVLKALQRAGAAAREHGAAAIPLHLRNAPTALLREQGYGRGYRYPHDEPDAFVAQRNLPDGVSGEPFYEPGERGAERAIAERLTNWRKRRRQSRTGSPHGRE